MRGEPSLPPPPLHNFREKNQQVFCLGDLPFWAIWRVSILPSGLVTQWPLSQKLQMVGEGSVEDLQTQAQVQHDPTAQQCPGTERPRQSSQQQSQTEEQPVAMELSESVSVLLLFGSTIF